MELGVSIELGPTILIFVKLCPRFFPQMAFPKGIKRRRPSGEYELRGVVAFLFLAIVFLCGFAHVFYHQQVLQVRNRKAYRQFHVIEFEPVLDSVNVSVAGK